MEKTHRQPMLLEGTIDLIIIIIIIIIVVVYSCQEKLRLLIYTVTDRLCIAEVGSVYSAVRT